MLSLYLAFMYANRDYYDPKRILCIAQYLFIIKNKNRLSQKGILKRFTTKCYGKQETLEDNRYKKAGMYKKLKNKRGSKEYEEWFLKYSPTSQQAEKEEEVKNKRV